MTGAVDTAITSGSAAVAVLALIVAYLARRDAKRSADAAEESARQARRSADADERAVELAAREADERAQAQTDAEGPTFERVFGTLAPTRGEFELRVVGGPGRISVVVEVVDAPWCAGFETGDGNGPGHLTIMSFGELEPGDVLRRKVGLRDDRDQTRMRVVLPLRIIATSHEDPPRTWERRVSVLLEPGRLQ